MATLSKAEPSAAGFGKLILASSGDPPREFSLGNATIIGRDRAKANIAFPEDLCISPVHARLEFNVKLQQAIINDLKSMNGVYVQIRQPVVLEDGDMFRLGEQVFGVVRW
jgi:pSer/pThr/pTyr-binding forkhead associated (FHA) protein